MNRQELLAALMSVSALAGKSESIPPTPGLRPLALANGWLGRSLDEAQLRGRVVVLDVFTFECINCVRVLPSLKRLYGRYARRDLEIVGVHAPEVPSYQSRLAYLARQKRDAAIPWPIAIDNGLKIWNAYGVSAWPTLLVFDRKGRLTTTIVGDGNDAQLAAAVSYATSAS